MPNMIRAVFDTVVFVRSLINPHSIWERLLFEFVDAYELSVSPPLLQEILEVIERPRHFHPHVQAGPCRPEISHQSNRYVLATGPLPVQSSQAFRRSSRFLEGRTRTAGRTS